MGIKYFLKNWINLYCEIFKLYFYFISVYDDHCTSRQNKYRQAYDLSRGTPPAIVTDTPEMIRIRKAQEQLSEVLLRTTCCIKFQNEG